VQSINFNINVKNPRGNERKKDLVIKKSKQILPKRSYKKVLYDPYKDRSRLFNTLRINDLDTNLSPLAVQHPPEKHHKNGFKYYGHKGVKLYADDYRSYSNLYNKPKRIFKVFSK
jgi:hypothetical protein